MFFVIGITIYWANIWGLHVNFDDNKDDEYVPMAETTFPSLSGMLALGLFIHNAIVTIIKNHARPERNVSLLIMLYYIVCSLIIS